MNVYLASEGEYEDRVVVGVYATLEAAQAAHRHASWSANGTSCEFRSTVYRRTLPMPMFFKTKTIPVVNGVAVLPDGREVRTNAKFVDVPELPDDIEYVITEEPGDWCTYDIEEREVAE